MTNKRSLPGTPRTDMFLLNPDEVLLPEDPKHPLYDPRVELAHDEGLVRNIMVHGVIEPIVVKMGEQTVVVDGRRRTRAAREARRRLLEEGKEELRIPAIRRRGGDADLYGVLVSANEHRLDDGPVEKARKAQKMIDFGKTEEEVCVAFGWPPATLKLRLKLLELSAPVRRAVESGAVSASAAAKLASVPEAEQPEALKKLVAEGTGKPTVKKAAQIVNKEVRAAPKKTLVKRVVKALEENRSEKARWFAWGAEWAIGGATAEEVREAGLKLPKDEKDD